MERTIRKTVERLTEETLFIIMTVASAVILPQLLHIIGIQIGVGGQLGQMFLPMYLPVMMLGFYRGPITGAIIGALSPVVSFALTGMPAEKLLPYIAIELVATGVLAGLLAKVKMPSVLRVLSVQALAKVVRLVAFAAVMLVRSGSINATSLTAGIVTSIPGLVLQLVVVSCFLHCVVEEK